MLEIHCPILKAPHVIFWHLAVVLVSGVAGFVIGWTAQKKQNELIGTSGSMSRVQSTKS